MESVKEEPEMSLDAVEMLIFEETKKPRPKQIFICEICNHKCRTAASLETHLASHKGGAAAFQCSECLKTFTQKGALVRHMPMHTGVRPHFCEECGKSFIHNSSFHMHKLAHAGIRDKKCDVCNLKFASASHLARHKRIHTGEKPWACPVCGKTFAQRYNMTVHHKTHEGISRKSNYACDICRSVFSRKGDLDKHQLEEHSDVVDETNLAKNE